jgi:hypothetical protein
MKTNKLNQSELPHLAEDFRYEEIESENIIEIGDVEEYDPYNFYPDASF